MTAIIEQVNEFCKGFIDGTSHNVEEDLVGWDEEKFKNREEAVISATAYEQGARDACEAVREYLVELAKAAT